MIECCGCRPLEYFSVGFLCDINYFYGMDLPNDHQNLTPRELALKNAKLFRSLATPSCFVSSTLPPHPKSKASVICRQAVDQGLLNNWDHLDEWLLTERPSKKFKKNSAHAPDSPSNICGGELNAVAAGQTIKSKRAKIKIMLENLNVSLCIHFRNSQWREIPWSVLYCQNFVLRKPSN